jgi:hypothetical protein
MPAAAPVGTGILEHSMSVPRTKIFNWFDSGGDAFFQEKHKKAVLQIGVDRRGWQIASVARKRLRSTP